MKFAITPEIMLLSEISANIALDRFKRVSILLTKYNKSGFDPVKLYELILQTYLFCGFPSMIESLKLFRQVFKNFKEPVKEKAVKRHITRGIINCKLIYKKNYKKLIENMSKLSPELKEWMISEGYGKVMGRKGLSIREREIMNISILAARYFESQLISHIRGCLNTGVERNDVKSVIKSLSKTIGRRNTGKALKILDSQIR